MSRPLIFTVFTTLLFAGRVEACTCIAATTEQYVKAADFVFVGTVQSSQLVSELDKNYMSRNQVVVLNVDEAIKGETSKTFTLYGATGGSCGALTGIGSPGEKFLIFAHIYSEQDRDYFLKESKLPGETPTKMYSASGCGGSRSYGEPSKKEFNKFLKAVRKQKKK